MLFPGCYDSEWHWHCLSAVLCFAAVGVAAYCWGVHDVARLRALCDADHPSYGSNGNAWIGLVSCAVLPVAVVRGMQEVENACNAACFSIMLVCVGEIEKDLACCDVLLKRGCYQKLLCMVLIAIATFHLPVEVACIAQAGEQCEASRGTFVLRAAVHCLVVVALTALGLGALMGVLLSAKAALPSGVGTLAAGALASRGGGRYGCAKHCRLRGAGLMLGAGAGVSGPSTSVPLGMRGGGSACCHLGQNGYLVGARTLPCCGVTR